MGYTFSSHAAHISFGIIPLKQILGKIYTLYSLCLYQFYYLFPLNEECAIISNVVSTIVKILQVFVHGSKHLLCYSADITSELWSARPHTIPSLYFTYFLIHFHHRIWDNIMMIKTFAAKAWPVFLNLRKTKVNWKDFFTIIFYLGLDILF